MAAVSTGSRTITASASRLPPRRRRPRLNELATPLGATFLGVLLVHNLISAGEAHAAETGAGGAAPDGGIPLADDPGSLAGAPVPDVPAASSSAVGSVISVGSLIDLGALTQLSGDARFAETALLHGASAAPPPTPAFLNEAGLTLSAGSPPGAMFLSLADQPLPVLPADALTPVDDQAAPPIGTYVKAGNEGGTITGTGDADVLLGGTGTDTINAGGGQDTIEGGGGNDVLNLGSGDDFARGDDGNDVINGQDGNDTLYGGAGNDTLDGGSGNDILYGDAGDDRLVGGPGADAMYGGSGNDTYVIDHVADRAVDLPSSTDAGIDTIEIAPGYASSLKLALPSLAPQGAATFVFGTPDPTTFPSGLHEFRQQVGTGIENLRLLDDAAHDAVGDAGANHFEGNSAANHFYGGDGNDELYGNGGADHLFGQGGIDHLEGGAGNDWLDGGAGDDWLDGGDGADQLFGGAGDDTFVLGLHESPDTIFDHEGSNVLRFVGGDAAKLTLQADGEDLLVGYGGSPLAVIKQYAGHESAFAGIDFGSGVQPLTANQIQAAASADLLAEFLEPKDAATATSASDQASASATPAAAPVPEPTPQVHAAAIPALDDLWVPPEIDLTEHHQPHETKHA
ncbi:MAG: calcium-binding protein [Geminicoccaceae bacterium]